MENIVTIFKEDGKQNTEVNIEKLSEFMTEAQQKAILKAGKKGKVELRVTRTHIEWRRLGETNWTRLIALSKLKGEKGDTVIGPRGPKGEDGRDGRDGEDGRDGKDGRNGRDGRDGRPGRDGEKGEKGDPLTFDDLTDEQKEELRGPEGKRGPRGYSGGMGQAGLSAYQVAQVIENFQGTPEEWLESLKGKSAYKLWLEENGWTESEKSIQDFLNSLGGGSGGGGTATVDVSNKADKHKLEANAKDFGAKGDGVADDTQALQSLFDSGREAYIPAGTYLVRGLVVPTGLKVRGAGKGKTVLKNTNGHVLDLSGPRGLLDGVDISNMSLDATGGHAIKNARIARSKFHDLFIYQRSPEYSILGGHVRLLLECTFRDITSYAFGVPRSTPAWNIECNEIDGVTQNVWDRCVFWNAKFGETGDDTQFYFRLAASGANNKLRNNTFREITMENTRGGSLLLESVTGTLIDRLALWDVPAKTAKQPIIKMIKNTNNSGGCQDTVIRESGRAGDGPADGVQDIQLDGNCIRTTIDGAYVTGTGVVLRLDLGGSDARLNNMPTNYTLKNSNAYFETKTSGITVVAPKSAVTVKSTVSDGVGSAITSQVKDMNQRVLTGKTENSTNDPLVITPSEIQMGNGRSSRDIKIKRVDSPEGGKLHVDSPNGVVLNGSTRTKSLDIATERDPSVAVSITASHAGGAEPKIMHFESSDSLATQIVGIADPTQENGVATKSYVDAEVAKVGGGGAADWNTLQNKPDLNVYARKSESLLTDDSTQHVGGAKHFYFLHTNTLFTDRIDLSQDTSNDYVIFEPAGTYDSAKLRITTSSRRNPVITGAGDPEDESDVATKKYVDEKVAGAGGGTNDYNQLINKPDLSTKLDKVNAKTVVYCTTGEGQPFSLPYRVNAQASTIAMRGSGGTLDVATPTQNQHAATKQYVDDSMSSVIPRANVIRNNEMPHESAMVNVLRADRVAFLPPDQVTVEFSENQGQTWEDANISEDKKRILFAGNNVNSNTIRTNKSKWIRITMDVRRPNGSTRERYVRVNTLYTFLRTEGGKGEMKIEHATIADPNNFSTFIDWGGSIYAWPGNVYVKHNDVMWGGANTQGNQVRKIRVTYRINGGNTSGSWSIGAIKYFGPNIYEGNTPMAVTDSLYSWDENQNATFPANVSAADPTRQTHLATKKYVDERVAYKTDTGTPSAMAIVTGTVRLQRSGADATSYLKPDAIVFPAGTFSGSPIVTLSGVRDTDYPNDNPTVICSVYNNSATGAGIKLKSFMLEIPQNCEVDYIAVGPKAN